jgi:hypothetical protein
MKTSTQVALALLIVAAGVAVLLMVGPTSITAVEAQTQGDTKKPAPKPDSPKSAPTDPTKRFSRETVPEDYAPGGKKAIPPGILREPQDKECVNGSTDKKAPDAKKTKSGEVKQ